jgi:VWFA-related protein
MRKMMSIPVPKLLTATLLAVSLSSGAVYAQLSAPAVQPDSGRISLDVVVTPKSGKPVAGLHQSDFTVLDNHIARPIASFSAFDGPQTPVEIILLIDAVNTDYANIAFERQQIDAFLKSNGGHLEHPVTLAIFTDTGTQIQQTATEDGNQLSAALDQSPIGLREIRRTSQYEADDRINLSLTTLQSLVQKEAARPGRKLIFWVSPGWPLLSGPRVDLDTKEQQQIFSQVVGISNAMRRNNITLYSIDSLGSGQSVAWEFAYQDYLDGVTKASKVELGNLALQVIAIQSGGLALGASNDIARHIEQCMSEASAYYRITYDAPPADQSIEYHRIDVRLSQPGLVARTRTGYYAQAAPAQL